MNPGIRIFQRYGLKHRIRLLHNFNLGGNMPIRVIDPNATKEIIVSGSKVIVKILNVAQKHKMALLINPDDGMFNVPIEEFTDNLAEYVVSIEGCEGKMSELLLNIESVKDFFTIVNFVVNESSLNEEEEKNLHSSSDVEKTNSAGNVEKIVERAEKPVSGTMN